MDYRKRLMLQVRKTTRKIALMLFGAAPLFFTNCPLHASFAVVVVRDVVASKGLAFNGVLRVAPKETTPGDQTPIVSVPVINGMLEISLRWEDEHRGFEATFTPNASDQQAWTEEWVIPRISSDLRLTDIRVRASRDSTPSSEAPAQLENSPLPRSRISEGAETREINLPIPITGVSGLVIQLNNLQNQITTLSQTLSTLTTAVSTLQSITESLPIVNEVPSGPINGTNALFSVQKLPYPSSSLALYRNGVRQALNGDYTMTSNVITFKAASIPVEGDNLLVDYTAGPPSTITSAAPSTVSSSKSPD